MKIKIYIILVIVSHLLCVSCKKQQDVDVTTYVVNSNVKDKVFNWPQTFKIEEIIQIETTEESILGSVKKVVLNKDKIFILDNKNQQISVYNRQGKLLLKLDQQGNGPREYLELRDFCINKANNQILILDYKNIIKYDLESGKYIDSYKLSNSNDVNPLQFIQSDENSYFLWNSDQLGINNDCLFFWDSKKYKGILKCFNAIVDTERFIKTWDGNYLFVPPHGNFIIYEIKENKLLPKYRINFGNLAFPESKTATRENISEIDKDKHFKRVTNVQETHSYLYVLAIGPQGKYYEILVNKESKEVIAGRFNVDTSFRIIASDETSFYALVEPSYIINSSSKSNLFPLKDLGLNELDNPIIVKFRI